MLPHTVTVIKPLNFSLQDKSRIARAPAVVAYRKSATPIVAAFENGCVAVGCLRNHGEAKGSEIGVKSKRRHVIEERGYNYK